MSLGVLTSLANALSVIGKPGARLLDDAGLNPQIDQFAALRYPLAVHDIEIDDLERRRHLVLDDLDASLIADDLVPLFDRADTPDVETNRGVEFECVAARRGLRIAEHYSDLVADLIDEDQHCARTGDRARQLAQCLAHQPGVQPHMAVAHFAFELGARHEGRHRIDDQDVNGSGADQRVRYLERLLAGIGLGNQQVVDIDAELAGIGRVERVLGVDEGAGSAAALRFGNDMQGKRRLAGALWAVNLDNPPARQPANAERDVETQRSGRYYLGIGGSLARSELHDRTLAESAFYLPERRVQRPLLVHCFLVQEAQCGLHWSVLLIPYPMLPCNAARDCCPELPCVHLLSNQCNTEARALRHPCAEDVSHFTRELLQAERLGQKLDTDVAVEALTERVLGIFRNEDYFHFRVNLAHFADEPGSVHMRHNDIGDQKIDSFARIADQIERRFAASRFYYLIPFVAHSAGAEDPERLVILDEHDGAVPSQILYCGDFNHV